jgi:hypothetical protein
MHDRQSPGALLCDLWIRLPTVIPRSVTPAPGREVLVGEAELYWHAGDGGFYQNQGIESFLFVFLKQLQARTARRTLLLAFDSSFPFDVGEWRLNRRAQPFSLWTYDYTRMPVHAHRRRHGAAGHHLPGPVLHKPAAYA